MDWGAITGWLSKADWLAISTGMLALATSILAFVTWRGVRENKHLIDAAKRQSDLLWENAVPYLIPEYVDGTPGNWIGANGLRISYAAGTIPARAVRAWVGSSSGVRFGATDLLTPSGNNMKVLDLVQSRAGSEPPKEWDAWLRRAEEGVGFRVVIRWSGPGDHVTERAWWVVRAIWAEVPAAMRG